MSLCEQIMGTDGIDARAKSIIDRCTANVYREYTGASTTWRRARYAEQKSVTQK